MLLRLKKTFDFKVIEADKASLSQQRKIEELEAQLQEAEDIVRDLREELSEVHAKLENTKKNQATALDERNLKRDTTTHENGISPINNQVESLNEQNLESDITTHENGLHNAESTFSQPNSQLDPEKNSGLHKILNGKFEGSICYSADNSHANQCYNDTPGFVSLVMRRKEPELYKNGCTQRIRAIERKLLDGDSPDSKLNNDAKDGTFIGRNDDGEGVHVMCTLKDENYVVQETPCTTKVTLIDYSHVLEIPYKSFRKKRRRAARYKKSLVTSCKNVPHNLVKENFQEESGLIVDNENELINSCMKTVEELGKETIPASSPKYDGIELNTPSRCADATGSHVEATGEDEASINKSDLTRRESLLVELEVPPCKTDLQEHKESEGKLGAKVSDLDNGVEGPPVGSKFLKYTFRRKRKKSALCSPEQNSSLKRNTAEKQNDSLEPQSSGLITDSSRDSRRLAQVAHQLISLSEKKWW
ncbi:uncharacterized protein LOC133830423 isoform X2 [Humulus lupulus]|nr:uncharacterized protein LOC133830423 isoform X2 [Humulus lupulus]